MKRFTLCSSLIFVVLLLTQASSGVSVGPRVGPVAAPQSLDVENEEEFFRSRMNIPQLRLAIPVLDPGIPESTKKQEEEGIWPELRKAEAVRCAFKLKQWITNSIP